MQTLINTSSGRLNVYHSNENNNQPTIIFLHDSLGCIETWRDFPFKLGSLTNCNVFIYDRQGHGGSAPFNSKRKNDYMEKEADVLHEIICSHIQNHAILFGHSDGGSIALIYTSKYPEKVVGVISESAHIFVENITLEGVKEAATLYESGYLKYKLEKYHGEKTGQLFEAWAKTWLSDEFKSWNIENFLPGVKAPLLVIQGETDEFGSLKQVEGIVNQTGGYSEQLILEGVGHTPHRESNELVLNKSAEFINKIISNQSNEIS